MSHYTGGCAESVARREALVKLLAAATAADGKGTLGVSLSPLGQAVTALLALLPPA